MNGAFAGLIASLGVALIITALTLPNRKSPQVINSSAHGLGYLEEASLGLNPHWTTP